MTDRIANLWGKRTPFGSGEEWPVRVDQFLEDDVSEEEVDRWVQTASVLHSNGDALDVAVKNGRIVGIRGRVVDRMNRGRVDPAMNPAGRAILKAADYLPPHEEPNGGVPLPVRNRPYGLPLSHPHQDRAPRNCRTQPPMSGSRSALQTQKNLASKKAIWCGSSRREDVWRPGLASTV